MNLALLILLTHVFAAIGLSQLYLRRYPLARPSLGVLNLWDVGLMLAGIVLIPYFYLALPRWAAALVAGAAMLGILGMTWEPVLRARPLIWLASLALAGADIGAALAFGATSGSFFAINNAVLVVGTVGVANLWAQSGLKARDLAVLAGALTLYDFVFTSKLPLMTDLFSRLSALPFAPMLAWPTGNAGHWVALGLGDLLMAAAAPLVMGKAYGRAAAFSAAVLSFGAILCVVLLPLTAAFPVMVVLGPLTVLQYFYWRKQRGAERTTREYLCEEPLRA